MQWRFKSLIWLLPALTLPCGGCAKPAVQSASSLTAKARSETETTPKPQPASETDPTCCGLSSYNNEGIEQAWRLFTQDGRFRLARFKDMRYSAAAISRMTAIVGGAKWVPYNQLFAYSMGNLGFAAEQDSLAAIVVDNERTDDARYGLVIFSKPRGKGTAYEPYWLYRERDLSKSTVSQTSGAMSVTTYREDGTYEMCRIRWDARRRLYVCR